MAQITFEDCNFSISGNSGKFYCDIKPTPTGLCDKENCIFIKTHNNYEKVELAIQKLETAMLLRR